MGACRGGRGCCCSCPCGRSGVSALVESGTVERVVAASAVASRVPVVVVVVVVVAVVVDLPGSLPPRDTVVCCGHGWCALVGRRWLTLKEVRLPSGQAEMESEECMWTVLWVPALGTCSGRHGAPALRTGPKYGYFGVNKPTPCPTLIGAASSTSHWPATGGFGGTADALDHKRPSSAR
ncbi:hypothetical protein F4780DRAFT_760166 [Xylariomycetidae sp. FL0641]|nr:hypothetical protein F4780DRAFT_760166 [Xylariomycetidae sp. FL0641]